MSALPVEGEMVMLAMVSSSDEVLTVFSACVLLAVAARHLPLLVSRRQPPDLRRRVMSCTSLPMSVGRPLTNVTLTALRRLRSSVVLSRQLCAAEPITTTLPSDISSMEVTGTNCVRTPSVPSVASTVVVWAHDGAACSHSTRAVSVMSAMCASADGRVVVWRRVCRQCVLAFCFIVERAFTVLIAVVARVGTKIALFQKMCKFFVVSFVFSVKMRKFA